MKFEDKLLGQILILKPLEPRIDATVAKEFKGRMVDWMNQGINTIILDLSSIEAIDSSGLGAIISSLKTLGEDGHMHICSVRERVMKLFRLTRMDRVFEIFPTREEAIAALPFYDRISWPGQQGMEAGRLHH